MKRPTLPQACSAYVHRYTMEHVPAWAKKPHVHTGGEFDGQTLYYAPQFASDAEWFANTKFKGDSGWYGIGSDCQTSGQTWPIGKWLNSKFGA